MALTFTVEVDWAGNGTWTDETGRCRRVQSWTGFARADDGVAAPGRCTLTLDNSDRRFSPANAASPLYGNLLPRRAVRVKASDGTDTWVLFRGTIQAIRPQAGAWAGECVIECVDWMGLLAGARVSVDYTASQAVDDAVAAIVALVTPAPPATSYADNGDSLAHVGRHWPPEATPAVAALADICRSVYGRFYVARDGTATFMSRTQRQDPSVSASLVIDGTVPLDRLDVALGTERLVNLAQVTVYPVETVGTLQALWTARTTLRVAPGQTRTIYALFRDENGARCGALDVVEPVPNTDYTVNEFADGSGVDYTTSACFSLSAEIEATRARITLGNTALGPLYVTALQVRGKPLRTYDPLTVEQADTASQASYGVCAVALDLPMQPDPVFGAAYAEYLVGRFKQPALAADRLTVRGRARLGEVNVFSLELMDKVTISDAASGLSGAGHWIRAVEYDLAPGSWSATLYLERADDRRYCLLDRAGYAELDASARLAF